MNEVLFKPINIQVAREILKENISEYFRQPWESYNNKKIKLE